MPCRAARGRYGWAVPEAVAGGQLLRWGLPGVRAFRLSGSKEPALRRFGENPYNLRWLHPAGDSCSLRRRQPRPATAWRQVLLFPPLCCVITNRPSHPDDFLKDVGAVNVLLVRLSAIGDVVHTAPLACALKDYLPEIRLTWVAERPGGELLVGHRAIDELILLPRRFLRSPVEVVRLVARLRRIAPQVAIDAQGLTKSAVVCRLSGAPRRIGFGRPWGREISRWLNNQCVDTRSVHAVPRNLELLRPLGIESPEVRFDLPELPPDRAFADELIERLGLSGRSSGFALLTAGAGWESKRWPAERFAAVARHLALGHGLCVLLVWGSQTERALAEGVARESGTAEVQPAPRLTLPQLAALARRARLFLGGDTGPLHIAAAVDTPCIGLYGPWPAAGHGPYGAGHIALQGESLDGSTRRRRRASRRYIEAISVEAVCDACDCILRREGIAANVVYD